MKRRTLVAASLLLPAWPAAAQEAWPSKPVQLFVPFPPGGVADITARPLAHVMGRLTRQSMVVVNKPGAGGAVGTAQAARATPDGYTLLVALSSISVWVTSAPILRAWPCTRMPRRSSIASRLAAIGRRSPCARTRFM